MKEGMCFTFPFNIAQLPGKYALMNNDGKVRLQCEELLLKIPHWTSLFTLSFRQLKTELLISGHSALSTHGLSARLGRLHCMSDY